MHGGMRTFERGDHGGSAAPIGERSDAAPHAIDEMASLEREGLVTR
jgi:hypothetical protein